MVTQQDNLCGVSIPLQGSDRYFSLSQADVDPRRTGPNVFAQDCSRLGDANESSTCAPADHRDKCPAVASTG